MPPAVHYLVKPLDPRAHLFAVRCTVPQPDPRGQVLRLPSWIRGSYMVRDFAKHVVELRASSGGVPLAFERLDKRSLRCAPCADALTLEYTVYAYDESVRKAYLDPRRGFFNGSSLFYCPEGRASLGFELEIEAPSDPAFADWKVATTLPARAVDARGFGLYAAADYEELIDHPVELGAFERLDFAVDGIEHAMVLSGRYELDRARLTRDLTRICHAQRALFGHEPALAQYLFLTNVVGAGYGGLEHRSSTALICARTDLPHLADPRLGKEYRGFLGLCSHEYFHLWNVKRIAPAAFLQSDLAAEAYTRDLWHYEGTTSYYDDLMMLRAGIFDAATYLDVLAENATRLQRTPGRRVQTLADASFEAWIKYYQPDENFPNAGSSYYVKGALASLCLDLKLRKETSVTLDDAMRALWQRHGSLGVGAPEGALEAIAQELSGLDLRDFFDRLLRSTEELPLEELLAHFGVAAELRPQLGESDTGGRCVGEAPGAWIGLKLRPGDLRVAHVVSGSPAARAGVSGNDLLVALNELRLAPPSLPRAVAQLVPGREYALHWFRGDELMQAMVMPESPPVDTWTFTLAQASGEVLQRRQKWIGC